MDTSDTNLLGNKPKLWYRGQIFFNILLGLTGVVTAMVIMAVSVGAAMTATESANGTPTPAVEATPTAVKVEYYLPYPGILPDSPLYKLKAVRDRVKLWLTFDESKKATLELALADKRINAALALAEGNKAKLAVTTATKAEKYLEQSTNRVIKLIKLGKDEKSQLLNLTKAIAKHAQVLEVISVEAGEGEAKTMSESIMLNKLMEERVRQLGLEVL